MKVLIYIYVASPYTVGDVAENVARNIKAADQLAVAGYVPFVPLLCHFWHFLAPHPYQFWIDQTLAWLNKCDAVLRLPGESKGADAEVQAALARGIPVFGTIGELMSYNR